MVFNVYDGTESISCTQGTGRYFETNPRPQRYVMLDQEWDTAGISFKLFQSAASVGFVRFHIFHVGVVFQVIRKSKNNFQKYVDANDVVLQPVKKHWIA